MAACLILQGWDFILVDMCWFLSLPCYGARLEKISRSVYVPDLPACALRWAGRAVDTVVDFRC